MPRGPKGLAPHGQKDWFGWPTTESSYARRADELVKAMESKQEKLEKVLGLSFDKRWVAGSSSGAYFAALLALHGGMAADGFGLMSGGAGIQSKELDQLRPTPVYVGYGTYDTTGPAAKQLGKLFEKAGWPVRIATHPVGHGAKEVYLDEAFAFFRER